MFCENDGPKSCGRLFASSFVHVFVMHKRLHFYNFLIYIRDALMM